MKIPFLSFDYQDKLYRKNLVDAFEEVLDSKWYVMGRELQIFENSYAQLNQVNYSLGVANGLDALIIALHCLGVGDGDEVIVPSNTYIATWLAVSSVGAIPVPVEPDESTFNINPNLIEEKITPRTKAIIPVHLYGQPCQMSEIINIASKHNLFVVEDNAQAHLATWDDVLTGSFGHINATSFYPGKNFGALGDGGGLTTNSKELYLKAKIYRNYGSEKKYFNEVKGINSRLDEVQAAFLNVKLPFLSSLTDSRKKLAQYYDVLFNGFDRIITPKVKHGASHVYHLYVILSEERDELQEYLQQKGIGTMIHYPIPPHLQKAYRELNYKTGDFPIAERIANTCLSLPLYPGMTELQIEEVVGCIKKFYGR